MAVTTISTKGQIVVPQALRAARGWGPGTRLAIEETPEGLLLRAELPRRAVTLDEVCGMLGRVGPLLTPEEEEAALRAAFARDHARD